MTLRVIDLGRTAYEAAYRAQLEHVDEVLAAREAGAPEVGRLLLVEHDPVITVTRRPGVMGHLLVPPELLAAQGVTVAETDRGGDITYHGPGQIVAYPILDLNVLGLGLHAYMRLLESAVIDACNTLGFESQREPGATGVWVPEPRGGPAAKVCAMGVRVRKWVSFHGLALNVTTNLDHFGLIVPCGLAGREVTSIERLLAARGRTCPPLEEVRRALVAALGRQIDAAKAARDDSVTTASVQP